MKRLGRFFALPSLSIHGRLLLLITTTVLPLIGFGLVQAYLSYEVERNSFSERAASLARALSRAVEADHQIRIAGLQGLAVSRALRAGDLDAFRPLAQEFIAHQPAGSTVGLADRTGQLLLAVGDVPPGASLPRRRNLAAQAQVFQTGLPVISDLFSNAITGKYSYTVEVPVFRDGQVIYVLALDPTPGHLLEVISQQRLQPGWVTAIIDPSGVVVARAPNMDNSIGRVSVLKRKPLVFDLPEGVVKLTALDGVPLLIAFHRSEPSDWRVNVGVPREMIYGPLRMRVFTIFGFGAAVLIASLALAVGFARSITRPITGLARFAAASTQRGHPLTRAERTGFHEVDEVGRVLAASTNALHTLADTLEQRVEQEVAERVRTEEALRQSQKMEIVGQLTSGIAHDFNNLLQGQMAALELLLKSVDGQERATRYAHVALESSEKGAKLTHSLLSFSRKQMLRPEAVDTMAVMARLRDLLARTMDPRIVLHVDVHAGLAAPLADSTQLEAALLNLCLNARDAMAGRGGQLLVEAYRAMAVVPGADTRDGGAAEPWIVFAVTDQGTGMDAATLARVCEPFFTTKGVGQGSGLGLSMVQGFARQSGGELLIESVPDVGTTARIWLPQAPCVNVGGAVGVGGGVGAPDLVDARAALPCRAPPARRGTGQVLLVDDDPFVRDVIAEALIDAGYDIAMAESGEQALAMVRVQGARYDAIVTDFAMPGITGGELMTAIWQEQPHIPGLVITGYAEGVVAGGIPAGCKVLHKPFRSDELVAHLCEMLELV